MQIQFTESSYINMGLHWGLMVLGKNDIIYHHIKATLLNQSCSRRCSGSFRECSKMAYWSEAGPVMSNESHRPPTSVITSFASASLTYSHRCQKSKAPHAWLPRNPHWNECRDNQHQSSMSNALWQDLAWQLYLGKITFFNFFERFYQLFPSSISPVCGRVGWERLADRFLEYFIYSYIKIILYIRIYIYIISIYVYIYISIYVYI